MDLPEKPKSTVVAWLKLSSDLRDGKIGLFHTLPADIQGRIFAQIHPRQSLDEWSSDNALCVREIVVPHHICSFDVSGDYMAYFAKRNGHTDAYDPHYLDLDYGYDRTLCEKHLNDGYGDIIPTIALCGDKIIFEGDAKNLWYMDKNGDGDVIAYFKPFGDIIAWACHPTLPLCVVISLPILRGMRGSISQIFEMQNRAIPMGAYEFFDNQVAYLKWHYCMPLLVMRDRENNLYRCDQVGKSFLDCKKDFQGQQNFSFDGGLVVLKHENAVYKWIMAGECFSHVHKNNQKKFVLHGFGESMFLMEDADKNSSGDNTFIMQSVDTNTIKKMTSFNGHKGLHRLPRNHDYRYITIEPSVNKYDATKTDSKISIFVPGSTVCFQHYCMMQALMEADKSENAADMDLFKKPELKDLVHETAAHYAFFKKKML